MSLAHWENKGKIKEAKIKHPAKLLEVINYERAQKALEFEGQKAENLLTELHQMRSSTAYFCSQGELSGFFL